VCFDPRPDFAQSLDVVAEKRLDFRIQPQPDFTTCGPTCLHAVYDYYGDNVDLKTLIAEIAALEEGGTLGVILANHALKRGYDATLYTYKLQVFDPTWFLPNAADLRVTLAEQVKAKPDPKLKMATEAYRQFLDLGGELKLEDLTAKLIRTHLKRGSPILTGLSATYLYRCAREVWPEAEYDDVRGEPTGHFVVLCGYDRQNKTVLVADPLLPNPVADGQYYAVRLERLICAILLGILTYDGNLVILTPKHAPKPSRR
jgi:hypothetical protein